MVGLMMLLMVMMVVLVGLVLRLLLILVRNLSVRVRLWGRLLETQRVLVLVLRRRWKGKGMGVLMMRRRRLRMRSPLRRICGRGRGRRRRRGCGRRCWHGRMSWLKMVLRMWRRRVWVVLGLLRLLRWWPWSLVHRRWWQLWRLNGPGSRGLRISRLGLKCCVAPPLLSSVSGFALLGIRV